MYDVLIYCGNKLQLSARINTVIKAVVISSVI